MLSASQSVSQPASRRQGEWYVWLSFSLSLPVADLARMYFINHWIPAFACLPQAGRNDNGVLFCFSVIFGLPALSQPELIVNTARWAFQWSCYFTET